MSLTSHSYPPSSTYVLDSFIQSYQEERLREGAAHLVQKAMAFFHNRALPLAVSYTPTESSAPQVIKDIFKNSPFRGVCIGELHTHWSPKKVIIDLLLEPEIQASVRTLFTEHLEKEIQDCLDQWQEIDERESPDQQWQEGNEMYMPDQLRDALSALDHKHNLPYPFSYTRLIIEAKKARIRVVAIDTSISVKAGVHPNQPLKTKERIAGMNYTAKKIIDMELKRRPGGFIILTGINHSTKLLQSEIPGLSELFQCPCVIISDTTRLKKEPGVHNNPEPKKFRLANEPGTVHSMMIVEKPLPPSLKPIAEPLPADKEQEPLQN